MRCPHKLDHRRGGTYNMGYIYPSTRFEGYPSDSFVLTAKMLARFTPQISPNMDDVFVGLDVYQVPWRQLFEKLGIDWDAFITGGEDGTNVDKFPLITVPATGWEKGSLADFLGYPVNWMDDSVTPAVKVIEGAGLVLNALPIVAYMHIINENYRDQNFLKKLDLTKYADFINGTYDYKDASGNSLGYQLDFKGLFPKAQPRDFFGKALPNTQRGPQAVIPIAGLAPLTPLSAPVATKNRVTTTVPGSIKLSFFGGPELTNYILNNGLSSTVNYTIYGVQGSAVLGPVTTNGGVVYGFQFPISGSCFDYSANVPYLMGTVTLSDGSVFNVTVAYPVLAGSFLTSNSFTMTKVSGPAPTPLPFYGSEVNGTSLSASTINSAVFDNVRADLSRASATSIIAFRLAARMQAFGEVLQVSGARAVEYTLAIFGVRIPDERIQRPLFHGSFRLPVLFSEVLQTSSTNTTSPQGNLAGHGITGGTNAPIHIKVIEHCYIMTVVHCMPRSSYQTFIAQDLDRVTRWDIPNPMFQFVGEQPLKRKYIYPNSAHPEEAFGYVPRYSELSSIPSSVHGDMKDTFAHYFFSKIYKTEPVLSAKWRYERPTGRPFAIPDADKIQMIVGYEIKSKRPFAASNTQPGIHIV